MQSQLFLNNITVIDHAYIGTDGRQHGGSFNASFRVTGPVIGDEQVLVDFSAIKKLIKASIDDAVSGFDHKLWHFPGWSNAEVGVSTEGVHIHSSAMEIRAPADILRVIMNASYDIPVLEERMSEHLEAMLSVKFPTIDLKVRTILSEKGFLNTGKAQMFRYSHGLRNSSSYGCQNIAHGHLSWIEFDHDEHYRDDCEDCQQALESIATIIRNDWDGAVLIDEANVIEATDDFVTIAYQSGRGRFWAKYRRPYVKMLILPHETTVEHIVAAFAERAAFWLERAHVKTLYISEGLAKGAAMEFNHV